MKKRNILIILAVVAVVVVAVVLIVRKSRKYKKIELNENGKDYLQIFHLDNSSTPPIATPYRYQTGAISVKVDTSNPVTAAYEVGGLTYHGTVVPISKVYYETGRSVNYNGNTDYISITTLNQ